MLMIDRPSGPRKKAHSCAGVSRRMLTRTLRTLEEAGLVSRRTYGPPPARVEYSLTELGHSLYEQVCRLNRRAAAHRP